MSKKIAKEPADLSLEQKIGLMLWCPFYGNHNWYNGSEFGARREMLRQGLIGGIVIKGGDLYETATLIQEAQKEAPFPLAVAADIENGLGSLLKNGTRFPSNMAFGATRSGEYGLLAGKITAEEAAAVGINLIFGPTCMRTDSGLPEGTPLNRSFGERLHLVTRLSIAYVRGVHEGGLLAAPRYFPGTSAVHGGEFSGPRWLHHLRKLLVDTELSIYEMLAETGLAALLADWREMPDLLTGKSLPVLTNQHLLEMFLREVMGFNGLVISPDLSEPKRDRLLEEDILVAAVNAGVDVLAGVGDPERVQKVLRKAVVQEKIPLSRIDKAAERGLAFRKRLRQAGSAAVRPGEIDKRVASRANLEVADRVAEDSITLVRDRKRLLPLDPGKNNTLLNLCFTARFDPNKGKFLDEKLRHVFDRVQTRQIDSEVSPAKLREAWQEAENAGVILCAMFTNLPPEYSAHGFNPTQVEFIQGLIDKGSNLIMVSFGDPRTIALFPAVDCYICLYCDCPASQAALVREIFGELVLPVKGKLPLTLDASHPYGYGLDLSL